MPRAPLLFGLLTFLAGCTHAASSSDGAGQASASDSRTVPATPAAESRARGVLLTTIATHDAKVSILGSGTTRDLRVVVRKSDGTMVADGISIEQLRAADPLLHELVTSALASGGGTYVDATLHQAPAPSRLDAN